MSHGAAGFAYALASLAAASGARRFRAAAAAECIAFEDSSYDAGAPQLARSARGGEPAWPCQWCHGAPGIGLARLATAKRGRDAMRASLAPISRNAVEGVEHGWPGLVDTLCCGTLGSIEFFCEAGDALAPRRSARARGAAAGCRAASGRGERRLPLEQRQTASSISACFADLPASAIPRCAGVDGSLPNVLIWE